MRISVGELWQKRLMAAGLPKTFEIGRVYRNEGSSPEHLQEFTNIEFYAAYMDYLEGMQITKELILKIADEVFETRVFTTRGHTFNLDDEWKELDYADTVKEMTGIDVLTASVKEMEEKLKELNVTYSGDNKERLTDTLWKYCRKQIAGPAFLINHPKLVSPLSKAHPENSEKTERAQLLLAGAELTNSFSELNDPVDQRKRFELQQELLEAGDDEAMMPEWEFVEMLEHGMPPTFGFGMGDRLFAFMVDKPIRETQLFPLMKPKHEERGNKKKKKEAQVAVAVVNTGAGLERWQEMNTVAHLNAAFGARKGKELFTRDTISTKDETHIKLNIGHAIMIKSAESSEVLRELVDQAHEADIEVAEFTREMIETTSDTKIVNITKEKNHDEIEYLGVLIFGARSKIESLTERFELYS